MDVPTTRVSIAAIRQVRTPEFCKNNTRTSHVCFSVRYRCHQIATKRPDLEAILTFLCHVQKTKQISARNLRNIYICISSHLSQFCRMGTKFFYLRVHCSAYPCTLFFWVVLTSRSCVSFVFVIQVKSVISDDV